MRQPKNLKTRLILYFTAATILLSISINLFHYYSTKNLLKKNMIENANSSINYITDNIEKQLKLAGQLSDWIFMNSSLERVKLKKYNSVEVPYDDDISRVVDILNDQIISSSIGNNISSLIISLDNGVDIRTGEDASMVDKEKIESTDWFIYGLHKNGLIYWDSIILNPSQYNSNKYVLPIVRPIISSVYNKKIGWSFIGFKESLISDVYKKFTSGNVEQIYVINSQGICVSHQNPKMIGTNYLDHPYIKTVLAQGKGCFDTKINGINKMIVFNKFKTTDWIIVEELSYDALVGQNMVLFNSTILVIFISTMISFTLTVYLSSNLTNPLKKLKRHMKNISNGNFTRDVSIEGPDEIGEVGKGINEMTLNIKALLDFKLMEEENKRKLELKLLQSQVNPHFLYNTLNSIKWMASVQKADGISNAVSALGRLLKNLAKGTSDKITLREETSLIEDYVLIQNIRYGGRIKFEKLVDREELMNFRIVKFTLQPIIENAVFHGIEPKKDAGRIMLSLSEADGDILISIEDDGVGMTWDKIGKLFFDPNIEKNIGISSMGIKNVDDRLKLTYGSSYGLDIISEEGCFTKVVIKIPKED